MTDMVNVQEVLEDCEAYVDDAASFPEQFKRGVVKRHQSQYRRARENLAVFLDEAKRLLHGVDRVNGLTVVQPHDLANFRAALANIAETSHA